MAIRYSGDVEVRMRWSSRTRTYRVTIRSPYATRRLTISRTGADAPGSPNSYDVVAREALRRGGSGLPIEKRGRFVVVRRVFQAPCPCRGWIS